MYRFLALLFEDFKLGLVNITHITACNQAT